MKKQDSFKMNEHGLIGKIKKTEVVQIVEALHMLPGMVMIQCGDRIDITHERDLCKCRAPKTGGKSIWKKVQNVWLRFSGSTN